jgi:spermidine synthase
MKRTEKLGEATAPDGTILVLYRHDRDYYLRVDGIELMSTRRHKSEDRLAELVCAPLAQSPAPRVLIGGLGLGFTLRAALGALPPDAEVVVVELLPEVIAWNRDSSLDLAWRELADPRVTLVEGDVSAVLSASHAAFDGIMLDVDNGADAITTSQNAELYRAEGVRIAVNALRPGGRLAYWSASADRAFAATLQRAGLEVEGTKVRAHGDAGPRHFLYVARRPSS